MHDDPSFTSPIEPLDPPPPLFSTRVLGPSAVFAAVAIGSGELIFWPGLSLSYGAGVLWIALIAVAVQYVVNVEIGRHSLATGQSIIVSATESWKGWGILLLLGAVVPWLWPGWARAGAQVFEAVYGIPEKPITIASLVICGALLGLPSNVYSFLEKLQSLLLAFIILGIATIFILVISGNVSSIPFWEALFTGQGLSSLRSKVTSTESVDYLTLLGGLVFAGAGGILNLGYGLFVCEKRFGMGKFARPVVGLLNSLGLEKVTHSVQLVDVGESKLNWKGWLKLLRQEHALVFLASNIFSIVVIALIFFLLLGVESNLAGTAFLAAASQSLQELFGVSISVLFVLVAFFIFFTSEIGIIDITSRIAAGILHATFPNSPISASLMYHFVVWTEIVIGILLTVADRRPPFYFLVTSAVLNVLVMAIYIGLVAYINDKTLPELARPGRFTTASLWLFCLLFLVLFVTTLLKVFG